MIRLYKKFFTITILVMALLDDMLIEANMMVAGAGAAAHHETMNPESAAAASAADTTTSQLAAGGAGSKQPHQKSMMPNDGSKQFDSIRTISDSGELSYLSKRRQGFLPSRGKKQHQQMDVENFFNDNGGVDVNVDMDDGESAAFLMRTDNNKRANGFLPMRGRKSSASAVSANDLLVEELLSQQDGVGAGLIDKRRLSTFMPMRGRKSSMDYASANAIPLSAVAALRSNDANAMQVPPLKWYPRGYYRVERGPQSVGPASFGNSFMLNNAAVASPLVMEEEENSLSDVQKRKGMGFFGARGKRSVVQ